MIIVITVCTVLIALLWTLSSSNAIDRLCCMVVSRSKKYRAHHHAKRIILIRHGESEGNQNVDIYATVPDHAIGLTDRGREQALECGQKLRQIMGDDETCTFYVSPFHRSKETCEYIAKAFRKEKIRKIREDPRIREQEWGNFQDLQTREADVLERKKIGRFFYRFRNGESGADVYDRVSSFMDSLYREMDTCLLPNNNMCIVSHGLFMRLFLMRFYRWPVEKFHTLENFDNCEYCILERTDLDGTFALKAELRTYPVSAAQPRASLQASRADLSFDAEAHPKVHTDTIGDSAKKNE